MIEVFILCGIMIFLTLCSAFFSGSEVALFSLSSMRVKTYAHDTDYRKKQIASLLKHPKDLLVTVFILNTLANILLQNVSSKMFGPDAGWDLKVGVPLFLTLFLGEIIPKNICMQNNVAVSYYVAPLVDFFHKHLGFIRKITIGITHPISRLLFFYLKKEEKISEEELEHVLIASEKHGVLHPDEAKLVWGYLKLHSATVKEVMVPAEDILYYDINEPLAKLTHLFVEQECTRIPVCRETLDNIVGIITAKDFFLYSPITSGIENLLTKPLFIPETTSIQSLMKQFYESNQVIALAVDEYGSISGLIAREDIAEQVIGDITDKRDEHPLYTIAGANEIIASGKFELSEFNRHFQVDLESPENMVTIGGWLIERIGEIPKSGSSYKEEGFLFQILASDPKRIRRLYIRKINNYTKP